MSDSPASPSFFETTEGVVLLSIGMFALIVLFLVKIRASNAKHEIKPVDLAAAILPVVVFLLVSGKVKSFQVGDVKVELAFAQAAQSPIKAELEQLKLPVDRIEAPSKGGDSLIDRYRAKKVEGLTFELGGGGYVASVIRDYLRGIPSLRYVVVNRPDGTLFAAIEALRLRDGLESGADSLSLDSFEDALNAGDEEALQRLPGAVLAKDAITESTDRLTALKKMEELNVDFIAAIDAAGKFAGVVKRSRLTSSMLVDIAERVQR